MELLHLSGVVSIAVVTKVAAARSLWLCLMSVCPQWENCFMSAFWHVEFWCGYYSSGKFANPVTWDKLSACTVHWQYLQVAIYSFIKAFPSYLQGLLYSFCYRYLYRCVHAHCFVSAQSHVLQGVTGMYWCQPKTGWRCRPCLVSLRSSSEQSGFLRPLWPWICKSMTTSQI